MSRDPNRRKWSVSRKFWTVVGATFTSLFVLAVTFRGPINGDNVIIAMAVSIGSAWPADKLATVVVYLKAINEANKQLQDRSPTDSPGGAR